MSGPALVTVDEDPSALADVERELTERYARHYRVICKGSADEALACLEELASAGDEVALVLAGAVALRDEGERAPERGTAPAPGRKARADDRVGRSPRTASVTLRAYRAR